MEDGSRLGLWAPSSILDLPFSMSSCLRVCLRDVAPSRSHFFRIDDDLLNMPHREQVQNGRPITQKVGYQV